MGRQIAMVMDLNKCIGCQTCTAACKSMWTDEPGQDHMFWNNVETKPGEGYPKNWEKNGGGWAKDGSINPGTLPNPADFGSVCDTNAQEVFFEGKEKVLGRKESMEFGPNWNEDSSVGEYPNNYHFYVPRICNHCTNPTCLEACPVRAIYKREEDGIVLIDQDRCEGHGECNKACPYDKIYFNMATETSQKCIFCFPRLEEGIPPACARQCPGRLRFIGYLDDENGPIHKLVYKWKVALPLHEEYGCEPNVFYVPPVLPPTFDENGNISKEPRVPMEYMESLFGKGTKAALNILEAEMKKKEDGKDSELMDILIAKDWKAMFGIPDVKMM